MTMKALKGSPGNRGRAGAGRPGRDCRDRPKRLGTEGEELLLEVAVDAAAGEFGHLGGDLLGTGDMDLCGQVGELGLALVREAASLLRLLDGGGELAEEAEVLGAEFAEVGALVGVGGVLSEGCLKLELNVPGNVALTLKHVIEAFEINGAGVCSVLSSFPCVLVVEGEALNMLVFGFDALHPLWRGLGWEGGGRIEAIEGDAQFI